MAAPPDHEWDNDGQLILTGSANAYVASTARKIKGYYEGLRICGRANFTNTGPATITVNEAGTIAIRKAGNAALVTGDIVNGHYYDFVYDDVNNVMQVMEGPPTGSAGAEVFNVKDYGAVGDGVTDDTVAVQAAINAAIAFTVTTPSGATGFISAAVYPPAGNYSVSGLTLAEGIRLYGDGIGQTFLSLRNGANTSLFTHTIPGTGAGPTTNFFQQSIIENMTLYGNSANQSGTSHGILLSGTAWTITTSYAVGAFIRHVQIYDFLSCGISIGTNRNFGQIHDVTIKDCGDKGILNAAYDWRIYNFDIGSCLYGYSQDAAGGTTLWGGNIYLNTEAGVNISSGVNTYLWFTGCSIDLNTKYGAILDGNDEQEAFGVVFDQCRFNGNSSSANAGFPDIYAEDCFGLTVTGCMFYAQGSNRPSYLLQTSSGGPVFWNNNHYRVSGGTQPWVTAMTNDFTLLMMAGDRETYVAKNSAGQLNIGGNVLLTGGRRSKWIPALQITARTTNGPSAGTVETAGNQVMFKTLDFDTTTQEFAQFDLVMEKSWDEGTVTAQFVWSHAAAVTNFGVVWRLSGFAASDDDTGDGTFGTTQLIADVGGTTNDIYVSAETPAVTLAGTPAAGDWCIFRIARIVADASDTLAVDARLHGVILHYNVTASNDA